MNKGNFIWPKYYRPVFWFVLILICCWVELYFFNLLQLRKICAWWCWGYKQSGPTLTTWVLYVSCPADVLVSCPLRILVLLSCHLQKKKNSAYISSFMPASSILFPLPYTHMHWKSGFYASPKLQILPSILRKTHLVCFPSIAFCSPDCESLFLSSADHIACRLLC